MQPTTKGTRDQAKGPTHVFRDAATLLLFVLLAVSVRFDSAEGQAEVEPLPMGVQAAELEEAASPPAEPAAKPARACPKTRPAVLQPVQVTLPEIIERTQALDKQLLILGDGKIRQVLLSARYQLTDTSPDCGGARVTLVRS